MKVGLKPCGTFEWSLICERDDCNKFAEFVIEIFMIAEDILSFLTCLFKNLLSAITSKSAMLGSTVPWVDYHRRWTSGIFPNTCRWVAVRASYCWYSVILKIVCVSALSAPSVRPSISCFMSQCARVNEMSQLKLPADSHAFPQPVHQCLTEHH